MKFFHLSDLHIGLKLIGRDLAADQEYILNEIVRKAGERRPMLLLSPAIYMTGLCLQRKPSICSTAL